MPGLNRRAIRFAILALSVILTGGCASTVVESLDHEFNYTLKFSEMPLPRALVVNSRVERETPTFLGVRGSTRNAEWEFELVATPGWARKLQDDFVPLAWSEVRLRSDVPAWFSPDEQSFSAFRFVGPSDVTSAQLFVEKSPAAPDKVRLFVCRH